MFGWVGMARRLVLGYWSGSDACQVRQYLYKFSQKGYLELATSEQVAGGGGEGGISHLSYLL